MQEEAGRAYPYYRRKFWMIEGEEKGTNGISSMLRKSEIQKTFTSVARHFAK
jgi:hypothetical protein